MEGYYGADFYRVSFLFTKVRRDSLRPEVYHVWGMNHYKKTITPFTGTCTVTRFAALPDTVGMANSRTRRGYTAFATYVLREDPTTKGAGVYAGQALLDFSVDARNQATQAQFEELDAGFGNPTEGGGLIFRGTWRNNATGQEKPACWAHGFATIMPDTLAKLGLGASDPTGIVALEKYGWKDGGIDDEKWWRPRAKSGQRR